MSISIYKHGSRCNHMNSVWKVRDGDGNNNDKDCTDNINEQFGNSGEKNIFSPTY